MKGQSIDVAWIDEAMADDDGRELVQAILNRKSFSTGAGSPRIPSASVARADRGNRPGENARDLPEKVWAYVQESRELLELPPLEPWATLWARASEEYQARLQGRTATAGLEYRVAMWSAAGLLD